MRPDRLPWIRLVGREPRSWGNVANDIGALDQGGARQVFVGGGEPTESPELPNAVEALRERGKRVTLVTSGRALSTPRRLETLVRAGVEELSLLLDPDHPSTALRCAALCHRLTRPRVTYAVVLDPSLDAAFTVAEAARADTALRVFRQLGPAPFGLRARLDDAHAAILDTLWTEAVAAGVTLLPDGLGRAPDPEAAPGGPVDADDAFVELFGRGVVPDAATAGVRVLERGRGLIAEGHTLAALGMPAVDLPPCLGGTGPTGPTKRASGCATCPAPCPGVPEDLHPALAVPPPSWRPAGAVKTAVVIPWVHDDVLIVSTLPALADALARRGCDVSLHHPYDMVWDRTRLNPPRDIPWLTRMGWLAWRTITRRPTPIDHYRPPDDKLGHPFWWREPEDRALALDAAFLDGLDLSGVELVVVPGYRAADRLLHNPTLSSEARLVIADFHMLHGAAEMAEARRPPKTRRAEGLWWPGDRVEVHSCFPRYARLYRAHGVPLRQVHWRPYPLFLGHFGSTTAPWERPVAFCGGRHFRDFDTLEAAGRQLFGVSPIEVFSDPEVAPAAAGPVQPKGSVPLEDFAGAIRDSRYVVLPMHHDVDTASGITVIAMALAAGRPVVASLSGGTLDHLRHDVDSLLVPPGDVDALAGAIARVDTDPATLARLAEGARLAAQKLSVEAWAGELVDGAAPRAATRQDGLYSSW